MLAMGDIEGARNAFVTAIETAVAYRLPHQIQRVIRSSGNVPDDVSQFAKASLQLLA